MRVSGTRWPMTDALARGALRTLVPLGSGSMAKARTSHVVAPAVSRGCARAPGASAVMQAMATIGRRSRFIAGQAGVNIGSGGPPSVGLNTTFTGCSNFSLSRSQSTMLVTMRGPSASVT